MGQLHTHYDNLKVARNAPPEVIRAAYKTLSQKYHPDRNSDNPDAIRVIQIINSAYAVLSDPAKRREHDEWIARMESQDSQGGSRIDNVDMAIRHRSRRRSRHGRHHSSSLEAFLAKHQHSSPLLKTLQKAWLAFDQLSRKLFRKT
ncbi:J domain-containing protein [Noviherbaspirillum aerium]|uniref:J domain-containing protein n=1 Tax=Noviherbaspirillum aerium TaxID=2588497 RepID=UPI00124E2A0B